MHMKAYECISAIMIAYESIWYYMSENGNKWVYMKVYEAI